MINLDGLDVVDLDNIIEAIQEKRDRLESKTKNFTPSFYLCYWDTREVYFLQYAPNWRTFRHFERKYNHVERFTPDVAARFFEGHKGGENAER